MYNRIGWMDVIGVLARVRLTHKTAYI